MLCSEITPTVSLCRPKLPKGSKHRPCVEVFSLSDPLIYTALKRAGLNWPGKTLDGILSVFQVTSGEVAFCLFFQSNDHHIVL